MPDVIPSSVFSHERVARTAKPRQWLIPPRALSEWRLELARALDDAGAVLCRIPDPSAWWPDRKDVDSAETVDAAAACWSCGAREACLSYALAAGERGRVGRVAA